MASVGLSSITDTFAFREEEDDDDDLGAENALAPAIFGRTQYQSILLEAYQKVADSQDRLPLFLHGLSGSGKTSLIDATLREKVSSDSQGYFCSGKFFQNSGVQEPYSAIMTAFADLCDLVVQADSFTDSRRKEIRDGLLKRPEEAKLLGRMINLSPFLGEETTSEFLGDTAAVGQQEVIFAKFKSGCRTFLNVIASEKGHPVVLFLDDIQWMDEGSKQLIMMFLADDNLRNIFLILAYRDEEADKVNDLKNLDCVDVQVENLDLPGVHAMVCAGLGSTSAQILDLSRLILKRTEGNPFFVIQFLDTIIGERLLQQDDNGSWIFDVSAIQREIMVSESVADLLHRKIQKLSPEMNTTLSIASVFGYTFDASVLLLVAEKVLDENYSPAGLEGDKYSRAGVEGDDSNTATSTSTSTEKAHICLIEALKAGFVERLDKVTYQFSHDKLQSAFLLFTDEAELELYHFSAGEVFLSRGADDPAAVYNAAVHFNMALRFFLTHEDRVKLAKINHKAACYCREMIAFSLATDLLRRGINLLDSKTMWNDDMFDFTFEMTEELAKMELFAGHFDSCKEIAAELLVRAKSTDMKITPLLLGVECRMAANEIDESIIAARHALQVLKISKFPQKLSLRHVIPKLISTKRRMARVSDDDILQLPEVNDLKIAATVRLLSHVCTYSLMRDDEVKAVYAGLSAMDLTLQHGLTPYSSTAVTVFGMSELLFGYHDKAYRCGKLAMKLLNKSPIKDAECATVGFAIAMLLHWKEPLCDLGRLMVQAGNNGLEKGEFVYGSWCFCNAVVIDTYLGQNLNTLSERYQHQYDRSSALGGDSILHMFVQVPLQFLANLQSNSTSWEQLTELNGQYMQEETYMQEIIDSNNMLLYTSALWTKAQLAVFFGLYDIAERKYEELAKVGKAIHLTYAASAWYEFAGIIYYEQYRALRRRSCLRKARRCKRKLARMATISPNTSMGLFEMKELSLRCKGKDATSLAAEFDTAIDSLEGMLIYKTMVNEDAGFACARLGYRELAEKYFRRAMDLHYNEWGSIAKYQWVEEKSAEALGAIEDEVTCLPLVGDVIVCQTER